MLHEKAWQAFYFEVVLWSCDISALFLDDSGPAQQSTGKNSAGMFVSLFVCDPPDNNCYGNSCAEMDFILEEKSQKRLTLISEMKILQVYPLWICMANSLVFQGVNCGALVQEKNMFHFESRPESTNGIPYNLLLNCFCWWEYAVKALFCKFFKIISEFCNLSKTTEQLLQSWI